jgi:pyruvate dehydrogenase E2 component (dihydrolipoamide acetyltransferase)
MAEVILMPRLSDSMEEGEIVAWHKKVGDAVEKGDLLAEINSDKATMDFESPKKGILLYIGVPEGGKLVVSAPIAVIGEKGEAFEHLLGGGAAAPAPAAASNGAAQAAPPSPQPAPVAATVASVLVSPTPSVQSVETHDQSRVFASPLAKEVAKVAGVSISNVQGSGDNGRIIKRDIEAVIAKGSPAPVAQPVAPAAPKVTTTTSTISLGGETHTDLPLSSMRKVIAKRLSESKFTAPHFYLTIEVNMDKAVEMRPRLNEIAAPAKISFNDLVVKASAVALRKHPVINSSWMGDFIRQNNHINVGVAVAVGQALFVPVIRHADMKSLSQISTEVRELAGKAKDGKLQLPEMQGNTFTISNLGMFDIEEFTAIINPPDACILAVGSIIQKPIVKNGEILVGNMMKVTLSCDHRVVDGATGAQFLQALKLILEDPIRLLV